MKYFETLQFTIGAFRLFDEPPWIGRQQAVIARQSQLHILA